MPTPARPPTDQTVTRAGSGVNVVTHEGERPSAEHAQGAARYR